MNWSLLQLLGEVHLDVEHRLATVRSSFGHATTSGTAAEGVWLDLFNTYLPRRYQSASAHVVDSHGNFSTQIDIVVFDRQYTPFIFQYQGQSVVPAESVYAVFEAKQLITGTVVEYAQRKVAGVRRLHRTSLPIPTASGQLPPKPLHNILGGLVGVETHWKDPFGESLRDCLDRADPLQRLDLGCITPYGIFKTDAEGRHTLVPHQRPATAFLFELIARLQACATVPMIDVRAYADWLQKGLPAPDPPAPNQPL